MHVGGCTHRTASQARGRIRIQNFGSEGSGIVLLCPGGELRVGRIDGGTPGRRRRTQRFDREEKEELVVWNDRTTDGRRHVVAMEWMVVGGRLHEFRLGVHLLVGEVVAHQSVKLIGAGLGGTRHLDGAGAAILGGKGIDLDA